MSRNCYSGLNFRLSLNVNWWDLCFPASETTESPQNQARHHKTLQEMYKTKARPNKKDVSQLLDLEFQARRAFIDSGVTKEQDRPTKILQAYPCFGELDHVSKSIQYMKPYMLLKPG